MGTISYRGDIMLLDTDHQINVLWTDLFKLFKNNKDAPVRIKNEHYVLKMYHSESSENTIKFRLVFDSNFPFSITHFSAVFKDKNIIRSKEDNTQFIFEFYLDKNESAEFNGWYYDYYKRLGLYNNAYRKSAIAIKLRFNLKAYKKKLEDSYIK